MNIKRFLTIGLVALTAFFIASCKEEDVEYLSLTGAPDFSLPAYGIAGQSFTFTASGVTDDDGNEVKYYWSASPIQTAKDTVNTYTVTLTDTLCTVTVTCTAYADGYYTSSTSRSISIISADRENGSIKGKTFDTGKDVMFTDPRDGFTYWCTTIGDKLWFKENLAYTGCGHALEGCDVTAPLFGMYYTWEEARTACPQGWRVSSLQDWVDAATAVSNQAIGPKDTFYSMAGYFMGDLYFNDEKMWEYWPQVKLTNSSGLSLMPAGYANIGESSPEFDEMYNYSAVWTADEKDEDLAYYRYIYVEKPDVMLGCASKSSFGASVRCVKDVPVPEE